MKQNINPFLMILLMFCLACLTPVETANADGIREPVYAGSFYPATRSELKASIEQLVSQVKPVHVNQPPSYIAQGELLFPMPVIFMPG